MRPFILREPAAQRIEHRHHRDPHQIHPRTVYLAFDSDDNHSGQVAAQWMSRRLRAQGVAARRVQLPDGQDPNSFFVEGGDARQFQHLLEAARP